MKELNPPQRFRIARYFAKYERNKGKPKQELPSRRIPGRNDFKTMGGGSDEYAAFRRDNDDCAPLSYLIYLVVRETPMDIEQLHLYIEAETLTEYSLKNTRQAIRKCPKLTIRRKMVGIRGLL